MKIMQIFIFSMIIMFASSAFSQMGFGTSYPDQSSILDVTASNAGVLFPALTKTQRDAISQPAKGLLIFNTTEKSFQYNMGSSVASNWISITKDESQTGTYDLGRTDEGWNYHDVSFNEAFNEVPTIILSYREGEGIDNDYTWSSAHFKVANASTTGFTIGIYETLRRRSADVFFDWIALPRTQ